MLISIRSVLWAFIQIRVAPSLTVRVSLCLRLCLLQGVLSANTYTHTHTYSFVSALTPGVSCLSRSQAAFCFDIWLLATVRAASWPCMSLINATLLPPCSVCVCNLHCEIQECSVDCGRGHKPPSRRNSVVNQIFALLVGFCCGEMCNMQSSALDNSSIKATW